MNNLEVRKAFVSKTQNTDPTGKILISVLKLKLKLFKNKTPWTKLDQGNWQKILATYVLITLNNRKLPRLSLRNREECPA